MEVAMEYKKLWEDDSNRRKDAQEIISYLLHECSQPSHTNSVKENFSVSELILLSKEKKLSNDQIYKIIFDMIDNNLSKIDDFEILYSQECVQESSESDSSKTYWKFYLHYSISNLPQNFEDIKFHFLGNDFSFVSANTAFNCLSIESKDNFLKNKNVYKTGGIEFNDNLNSAVYFIFTENGYTKEEAWEKVNYSFRGFRGAIEFLTPFEPEYFYFSSDIPKTFSRNGIPNPKWMFVEPIGNINRFTGTTGCIKGNIDNRFIGSITENFFFLENRPSQKSIQNLISDCLNLYSQAAEASSLEDYFLTLWQIAEKITLSKDFSGKTDDVRKRLSFLCSEISLVGSGFKETLKDIAEKRNNLVHQGLVQINQNDNYFLRILCDKALKWVISRQDLIPSKLTLSKIFEYSSRGDEDKVAIKEAIKFFDAHKKA
jgi:hypothetical protein